MKKHILLTLLALLALTSCTRYDADEFTGYTLPRASGYNTGVTNDWIYFNLRTGEIWNKDQVSGDIREGEQHDRTDWDLAFCGCKVRTNSGTSGIGQGGAADLGAGHYEEWTSLAQLPSDLKWVTDDSTVTITMSRDEWNKYLIRNNLDFDQNPWFEPNTGPATTTTSANPLLDNAMKYSGPPPTYTPSFHTYVVRTADGKRYFKLQLISWYQADVEIGDTGGQMSYYCEELK